MYERRFSLEDFESIAKALSQMLSMPQFGCFFWDAETISALNVWFPKALEQYYDFTFTKSSMRYKLRYDESCTWSRNYVQEKVHAYLVALNGYFSQVLDSMNEAGRLHLSYFEAHTPVETSALAPFMWLIQRTSGLWR